MRKEKAAQVLQHQDGGEQTRLDSIDELPANDFITAFSLAQGTIAAILLRGRAGALTTCKIAEIVGQDPRDVTKRINRERHEGSPILSDTCGFWLASDSDELRQCAAGLHRRAGEIRQTARALERCAKGGPEK